ncbi:MAG: Nramp family divalent metal transporter [Pirellulales bacterium]
MAGLPPWGVDELPEPLPFSARNVLRTVGPGAILLAGSIGGGEWLVGPAVAVQHGVGVFWIATVAIVLQLVFNLEAIRYTLYTGEPIHVGIMRLAPGSTFWAAVYIALAIGQLGIPALASASAPALFAAVAGSLPGAPDTTTLLYLTYGVIVLSLFILLFGGTIERMLEYASWAMIVYIFGFLLVINLFFVPFDHWLETLKGFGRFGYVAPGTDLMLLAALAATAGSGGVGNLAISNWVRDKGMGMGGKVGAIASAFGSKQIQLSHVGKVFEITPVNMARWKQWWKYVVVDQVWLWALGCFVGMFLNVNMATAIIPAGTNMTGIESGAYQADYLARHIWSGLWFLGLLNGFWILFSTHLGNTDILVRTVTDIVWVGSSRARAWRGGRISKVYYALLLAFTLWGMVAVRWGTAIQLFQVLATIAGVVLAVAAVQVLLVNTRLLPRELRPGWVRRAGLVACALFYGVFSVLVAWDKLKFW